MRERFTITISDFRGARHYSLHQLAKRFALIVVGGLLLTLLGGAGVIYALKLQIEQLQLIRAEKSELARSIEVRNAELRDLIAERELELHRMDLELGHIESLVGLKPNPSLNRSERLDTAGQTALEKSIMLRSIPSGWPFQAPSLITSGYGWRNHPVTGERAFHAAVDLRAPRGQEVVAAADGVVNFAAEHRGSGLGNLVILDHDFGFRTHYAHLSGFRVERGEFVRRGEVIGLSGATGMVKGPHLHYEIWHLQRRLNPEPFLDWSLSNYDELFEKEDRVKWESLAKGISQRVEFLERQ